MGVDKSSVPDDSDFFEDATEEEIANYEPYQTLYTLIGYNGYASASDESAGVTLAYPDEPFEMVLDLCFEDSPCGEEAGDLAVSTVASLVTASAIALFVM